jgi:hydroxymethylglutaryl-CoA lyase
MLERLPKRVTIYEVGPRDGLQNESRPIATADKVALVNQLAQAGLPKIEVTSFVHPKWIPQLSDASQVAHTVERREGVGYSCLVPNRTGLDKALACGMREVALFLSASETHNKKNINKTLAQTLETFDGVIEPAKQAEVKVRAYVSTAFGCPYEGEVAPAKVVQLVRELHARGVYQISLGDTIGVATPLQVRDLLERVLEVLPMDELALHFHDTRGTALANVLVGLEMGIATIDSAVGGLGGCPYAPGAAGNLATEDLVYMLHGMGIETGVDLDAVVRCSEHLGALVGHELPSKYLRAALGERLKRGRAA